MNINKLNPWYITGLTDSEGTFSCYIQRETKEKITVSLEFKITPKSHSEKVLFDTFNYFSVGSVVIDNRRTDTKKFHVTNLKFILNKILPHFDHYPCITSKILNYLDWKKIAILLSKNKNLTEEGVTEIKLILSNMNTKRSFEDKYNYCYSTLSLENTKLNPSWVQGFLDGEATFYAHLTTPLAYDIRSPICNLSLEVAQNSHDVFVLLALKQFFKGGYIKPKYDVTDLNECLNSRSVNRFILRSPLEGLIDFLSKYPLKTLKRLDFNDWRKILELKNLGTHKKIDGLQLMW